MAIFVFTYTLTLFTMAIDNITFMLSLDNHVYGVSSDALDNHPFNIITRMKFGCTYLYGVETLQLFAMSNDIEEIISKTSNGASFSPLFLKDDQPSNVITSKYDGMRLQSAFIDLSEVASQTNNILKSNLDDDFYSFCNDFLNDCEMKQDNDQVFESLNDHDMMKQCEDLLNDTETNVSIE